jgi:hypothetical protein
MACLVPLLLLGRAAGRVLSRGRSTAAARRAAEFRVIPGFNWLMATALAWERQWLALGFSLPFGTSLIAVASRPASRPANPQVS